MVSHKRLVILIDRYLPIIGGAQNNVHGLVQYFSSMGFRVTILTRRIFPDMNKVDVVDGIAIRRFGRFPVRIISKLLTFCSITWYLIRCRRHYDLVLCVPCAHFTDFLPAYVAFQITKIPYVMRTTMVSNLDFMLSKHLTSFRDFSKRIVSPSIWRNAISQASVIVTQSDVLRQKASQYGIIHCQVISSGIDTKRFAVVDSTEQLALRRRLRLPEGKIIVITTGRYVVEKNQITLIKAVERIENGPHRDKAHLLIVGATEPGHITSNQSKLKAYVEKRGLSDSVQFLNDVFNVEDYLRASDIFVLPSFFPEGMPNSLLEAMSCGLPVICSNLPQMTCIFPEGRGFFFPPTDSEALCVHLSSLISSSELRKSYGASLSAYAQEHYSLTRSAEKYARLFDKIICSARIR